MRRAADAVAYVDDSTLRELLSDIAWHPIRVIFGLCTGLFAAIAFLGITERVDLGVWVATLGPVGTAAVLHLLLRLHVRRKADDAGIAPEAMRRLRSAVKNGPLPLTPTSDSVETFLKHLRR